MAISRGVVRVGSAVFRNRRGIRSVLCSTKGLDQWSTGAHHWFGSMRGSAGSIFLLAGTQAHALH